MLTYDVVDDGSDEDAPHHLHPHHQRQELEDPAHTDRVTANVDFNAGGLQDHNALAASAVVGRAVDGRAEADEETMTTAAARGAGPLERQQQRGSRGLGLSRQSLFGAQQDGIYRDDSDSAPTNGPAGMATGDAGTDAENRGRTGARRGGGTGGGAGLRQGGLLAPRSDVRAVRMTNADELRRMGLPTVVEPRTTTQEALASSRQPVRGAIVAVPQGGEAPENIGVTVRRPKAVERDGGRSDLGEDRAGSRLNLTVLEEGNSVPGGGDASKADESGFDGVVTAEAAHGVGGGSWRGGAAGFTIFEDAADEQREDAGGIPSDHRGVAGGQSGSGGAGLGFAVFEDDNNDDEGDRYDKSRRDHAVAAGGDSGPGAFAIFEDSHDSDISPRTADDAAVAPAAPRVQSAGATGFSIFVDHSSGATAGDADHGRASRFTDENAAPALASAGGKSGGRFGNARGLPVTASDRVPMGENDGRRVLAGNKPGDGGAMSLRAKLGGKRGRALHDDSTDAGRQSVGHGDVDDAIMRTSSSSVNARFLQMAAEGAAVSSRGSTGSREDVAPAAPMLTSASTAASPTARRRRSSTYAAALALDLSRIPEGISGAEQNSSCVSSSAASASHLSVLGETPLGLSFSGAGATPFCPAETTTVSSSRSGVATGGEGVADGLWRGICSVTGSGWSRPHTPGRGVGGRSAMMRSDTGFHRRSGYKKNEHGHADDHENANLAETPTDFGPTRGTAIAIATTPMNLRFNGIYGHDDADASWLLDGGVSHENLRGHLNPDDLAARGVDMNSVSVPRGPRGSWGGCSTIQRSGGGGRARLVGGLLGHDEEDNGCEDVLDRHTNPRNLMSLSSVGESSAWSSRAVDIAGDSEGLGCTGEYGGVNGRRSGGGEGGAGGYSGGSGGVRGSVGRGGGGSSLCYSSASTNGSSPFCLLDDDRSSSSPGMNG